VPLSELPCLPSLVETTVCSRYLVMASLFLAERTSRRIVVCYRELSTSKMVLPVARVTGLLAAYHVRSDPRGLGVILVHRATPVRGDLAPGDDASEVAYFAPDDLPHDLAFASTRRALLRWRCGRMLE